MSFLLNIPDSLKHLFDGRKTRSETYFSPYLLATDDNLDARLVEALTAHENSTFDSPLTTPPSTPPPTPLSSPSPSPQPSTVPLPSSEPLPCNPSIHSESSASAEEPHRKNTRRNKKKSHELRKRRRQMTDVLVFAKDPARVKMHKLRHAIISQASPVTEKIQDNHLKPTSSGYLGTQRPLPEKRAYTKAELLAAGYRLHEHNPDASCPILHSETGSVIGLVVPGPSDAESTSAWKDVIQECTDLIEQVRPRCYFKPPRHKPNAAKEDPSPAESPEEERRGTFKYLNYGISYGNGQTQPLMLAQTRKNQQVLDEVRSSACFIRLASFLSAVFLAWAPKLFLYYAQVMASLLATYDHLHLPFSKSVFAAFTINFGPQTVCYPHLDLKNLAYGWCAITALGDYDWRHGGHLVLWDLKLIVEFPPGTTIFIPSALITHSNTAISPGERRYSFTMYTAGGLFRWVEHGFISEKVYNSTLNKAEATAAGRERWSSGFALFSTLTDLKVSAQKATGL
ncbi:hypothetical protein VNI00_018626 [Paramarasmius palmivorus]|uniref:Prolyl 4-hydroxylase alpha subunit Fe(2+) 2OG dioxygenase domain-containing protein n=1 Tax=Paramarasmius palmivorus TaxID=297713 RepID=A0AAW0AVN5_9AGAR